ncbi:MAG: LysE family translocator [Pseudomonadota bacterium]
MVTFETWLAFTLAAGLMLALPGPTNLLVMSYSLSNGLRAGLLTVAGTVPGLATATVISLLGLGALLESSVLAFTIVKWAGAAYLIYLGIKQWRSAGAPPPTTQTKATQTRRMLAQAFIVTLLNPKSFVFIVAFFPQFIDRESAAGPQFLILGATFLLLVLPINSTYALLAGGLRQLLHQPAARRWMARVSGGLLVTAGAMTAALRRP